MAKKTEEKKTEAPKKESDTFTFFNPLDALADLIEGKIFDPDIEPTKEVEKVTEEPKDSKKANDNANNQNAGSSAGGIININLGKYFKPAKPKRDSGTTNAEEKGKAAGEQE